MKFLTGMNLLLRESNEWERSSPVEYSLVNYTNEISKLMISWRKLELSLWPNLFEIKLFNSKFNSMKLWFNLYDLLIRSNFEIKNENDEILSILSELFENSNFGEFQIRLDLLNSFFNQIKEQFLIEDKDYFYFNNEKNENKKIKNNSVKYLNLIINILNYYKQFNLKINENFELNVSQIRKDLSDFVKLSKWDDKNYYMLKENIEKAHRKLNKFSKLFEEKINLPIKEIINFQFKKGENLKEFNLFLNEINENENNEEKKQFNIFNKIKNISFKNLKEKNYFENLQKYLIK